MAKVHFGQLYQAVYRLPLVRTKAVSQVVQDMSINKEPRKLLLFMGMGGVEESLRPVKSVFGTKTTGNFENFRP